MLIYLFQSLGASIAAKLLGIAGGLLKLSQMPACNVQVLGSQKKALAGFSKTQLIPHAGYISDSRVVQDAPPDLRRKAARMVSAKAVLAARVDTCHDGVHGEVGLKFKEDIERKLDKLQVYVKSRNAMLSQNAGNKLIV